MSRTPDLELPGDDAAVETGRGTVTFVGTATVILRYGGYTILTDPNFLHAGDHVHLGYGITAERQTDPALDIEDLPPVDFVLLSHFHGDHFDRVAQERLDRDLPIVTTGHGAENLADLGFEETYALDTWQQLDVRKGDVDLTVTATPGTHAPGPLSKALPPVMGSVLEFESDDRESFRLYVTGDTLMHDELADVPRRFPDIDLALLHLGGTKVLGIVLTMDAEQGVEAVELFDADTSIPIHYDDYDVYESSLAEFREAVAAAGLEDRVAYLDRGDEYAFEVPADRTDGA